MASVGSVTPGMSPIGAVRSHADGSVNPLIPCLALIGLIVPTELSLYPGGVAFTPGRIGILLLLFPALFVFGKRAAHILMSDLFVCATGAWMIGAAISVTGLNALWSAPGGESLEFLASYLIARAFFWGPAALTGFVRVLKFLAIVAIILAVGDFVLSRLIVHETVAAIVGVKPMSPVYRENFVRATSTFEHPILFGTFCSLVAAVSLYWERDGLRKSMWAGFCFIGCIISLTSAALLAFDIVLSLYAYDQFMRQYSWRWKALIVVLAGLLSLVFLVTNAPLGWLITHLTFDPESGYFRYLIWDAALIYIGQAPLTGYAFELFHNEILDATIDSVWLVSALRYGIPMIVFLLLANVTAFWPMRKSKGRPIAPMSTAFTVVLVMFMFTGLTVHFWNFMWIFWGLCIGVRASLREYTLYASSGYADLAAASPVSYIIRADSNYRGHRRYDRASRGNI